MSYQSIIEMVGSSRAGNGRKDKKRQNKILYTFVRRSKGSKKLASVQYHIGSKLARDAGIKHGLHYDILMDFDSKPVRGMIIKARKDSKNKRMAYYTSKTARGIIRLTHKYLPLFPGQKCFLEVDTAKTSKKTGLHFKFPKEA